MNISPINFYKPNFTSTTRTTYHSDSEGEFVLPSYDRKLGQRISPDIKMICSNSTNFFRRDLDWKVIGEIFNKQFPSGKVNIYDFACSDGSEAFSLIIALIEQLGEKKASRYFPIIATDIDPEIIKMANSGKIIATEEDMLKIPNAKKYFGITPLAGGKYILSPKEILTKNVIFKQASIQQGLDEVKKDKNNIILARNFWKYLSEEDLVNTTWKLNEKTNDNTLIIIGNFDGKEGYMPFFFEALGMETHTQEDLSENILSRNPLFESNRLKDKKLWDEYISANYYTYIPNYLKQNQR